MSLSILANGTLVADPVRRTATNGKGYATAQLRVPITNNEPVLVSLIAFASMSEALLALGKGDAIAVTGRAKLSSWTKDGDERHGLSVTVEGLLTPYLIQRKRERVAEVKQ